MSIEMGTIPEHPDLEALEAGTQGGRSIRNSLVEATVIMLVTEEDEDDARNKAATTAPQLYGRIRSSREVYAVECVHGVHLQLGLAVTTLILTTPS